MVKLQLYTFLTTFQPPSYVLTMLRSLDSIRTISTAESRKITRDGSLYNASHFKTTVKSDNKILWNHEIKTENMVRLEHLYFRNISWYITRGKKSSETANRPMLLVRCICELIAAKRCSVDGGQRTVLLCQLYQHPHLFALFIECFL